MPDTYEPEGGNTPTPLTPAAHHVRPVLLVLLGATIIVALSAIALLRTGRVVENTQPPTSTVPVGSLVITPSELTMDQGGYLKNLTATYNGEDVTQQAFWYSDNGEVATVATLEPNRGQVSALSVGTTMVHASINGTDAIARVSVTKPSLRVECIPIQTTARVGEEVNFIAEYRAAGVPNYEYEWTGDDGLTSTLAGADHTYTTPGVKKVHFKTIDTAGAVAEDDCEVTITQ